MNERLKLISDTKVRICRLNATNTDKYATVEIRDGAFFIEFDHDMKGVLWDAEGAAALDECYQSWKAAGYFAALADNCGSLAPRSRQ